MSYMRRGDHPLSITIDCRACGRKRTVTLPGALPTNQFMDCVVREHAKLSPTCRETRYSMKWLGAPGLTAEFGQAPPAQESGEQVEASSL